MFTRRLVLLIAALAAALTALVPAATAGAAAPDPERNSTKPARWHYYYGVTPAKLKSLAKSAGDRIIDLEVERTGPTKLAASLVRNSGPYARGWYWYYGKTADQIADLLDEKNARLIDLEPYVLSGKRVFAAVMVKNTGQAAKNWHWYHGVSFARVKELINEHKSRLIDLETYKQGGKKRFAVVMIRNSGVDASAWWWYVNVPLSTVQQTPARTGPAPSASTACRTATSTRCRSSARASSRPTRSTWTPAARATSSPRTPDGSSTWTRASRAASAASPRSSTTTPTPPTAPCAHWRASRSR